MRISRIVAWSLAGLIAGGSVAYAQTLGDIARKEEERRKAVKTPAHVYTLQDVERASGVDPTVPVAVPAAAPAVPAASAAAAPAATAAAQPEPSRTEPAAKDEAYWRGQFASARDKLERSNAYINALKTQYSALANRFITLSDAGERGAVLAEMQKAEAEISRLQEEVGQQTKELADLEVQARRAGVPAGWIRRPDF
jgi:hypothetical protein